MDEFDQALRSREMRGDGHTAARAGIDTALSSGVAAVRQLDAILAIQLHDDPVTMAVWQRDRRIDYSSRGRKGASPVTLAAASEPAAPGAAGVALRVAS